MGLVQQGAEDSPHPHPILIVFTVFAERSVTHVYRHVHGIMSLAHFPGHGRMSLSQSSACSLA